MTTTPSSELVVKPQGNLTRLDGVTDPMSIFLAQELFPLMSGLWPASAGQMDINVRGVAMAWGLMLAGFTAAQVRQAVLRLAQELDRPFAPRPAEVRQVILEANPVSAEAKRPMPTVSIRSLELAAESEWYQGRISERDIPARVQRLAAERLAQGYRITERAV